MSNPLSKFAVGDHVRVTQKMHAAYDKVGVVTDRARPRNWLVHDQPEVFIQFPNGRKPLPTQERHLILAIPPVTETLAEMAEQSGMGTPAKDMAEMEIDGEYVRGGPVDSSHDPVSHPSHYTSHPSNVECIEITRHMGFNLGNAFKYIWRADLKGAAIQDLEKAVFYIQDEIAKRKAAQ